MPVARRNGLIRIQTWINKQITEAERLLLQPMTSMAVHEAVDALTDLYEVRSITERMLKTR